MEKAVAIVCILTVQSVVSDIGRECLHWIFLVFQRKHKLLFNTDVRGGKCRASHVRNNPLCPGLGYIWLQQGVGCEKAFISLFKQRLSVPRYNPFPTRSTGIFSGLFKTEKPTAGPGRRRGQQPSRKVGWATTTADRFHNARRRVLSAIVGHRWPAGQTLAVVDTTTLNQGK